MIARNCRWTISSSGNTALNQLGLSSQVPADWSYISSGPYKQYQFGNVTLSFSHRSDSQLNGMSEKTILLIQAIRTIRRGNVTETDIRIMRERFTDDDSQIILPESRYTIRWVYESIREIFESEGE